MCWSFASAQNYYDANTINVNGRIYDCHKFGDEPDADMYLENMSNQLFPEFFYSHKDYILPQGNYNAVKQKINGAPAILVVQGINHIERYGTQCFGLYSLCFYVVQHKICQSTTCFSLSAVILYAYL